MSHSFHDSLPGFDERQILHDGCPECEYRGGNLSAALAYMDKTTFSRAWRRAFDWRASDGDPDAVGPVSHVEYNLLNVLWDLQVILEGYGVPLDGSVPHGLRSAA